MRSTFLLLTFAALLSHAGPVVAQAEPLAGRPEVVRVPTGEQMAKVLKRLGFKGQPIGWALLQCNVGASGALDACRVIVETPGPGVIGQVALGLAPSMRAKPAIKDGRPVDGGSIFVHINIGAQITGAMSSSYTPGDPSFAVSPVVQTEARPIKIPCPIDGDKTATCLAHRMYWADRPGLEESAPTILEAQQVKGFSAVSCQLSVAERLENCQIKGEGSPRVMATIEKIQSTLKAPRWKADDQPVAATWVSIVYDWTMLTKAATAIVAGIPDQTVP